MDMSLVLDYLARWGHFLFGITWIGLLYYFNFIQGEYFKAADASSRVDAFVKLVPNALWYFRWAALFTFLTGLYMLMVRMSGLTLDITLGALMGTLMFLNVWLIIWPNQKIVIASNERVKAGGEALPEAAAAAPKAGLASRTNTLFSFPMLFFMGSSAHFSHGGVAMDSMALIVATLIIIAIEVNAIVGKQGPMTTVRGVIVSGLVLTAVLWGVVGTLS
ncbi:MAG: antitermination protein NusG [Gammaproteobacteria bacterium]|nr:antitermination protein NusG [Gammaproteobacteria bacterium]